MLLICRWVPVRFFWLGLVLCGHGRLPVFGLSLGICVGYLCSSGVCDRPGQVFYFRIMRYLKITEWLILGFEVSVSGTCGNLCVIDSSGITGASVGDQSLAVGEDWFISGDGE